MPIILQEYIYLTKNNNYYIYSIYYINVKLFFYYEMILKNNITNINNNI